VQGFHQTGTGATIGIKDDHALVGKTVGRAEVFAESGIHAMDHVLTISGGLVAGFTWEPQNDKREIATGFRSYPVLPGKTR
jgi:hypothetical protein